VSLLNKKVVLWLALLIVLSSIAFAQDTFHARIEPAEVAIKQDQTAELNLSITHTSDQIKTFEIYSKNVIWDVRVQDAMRVEPSQLFSTQLFVRPLNINPGTYIVPLTVKQVGSNLKEEKNIVLEVRSVVPPEQSYLPAVRGEVYLQDDIDPRDELKIRVLLQNQNRRELDKVDVKIRSKTINQDYTASLGPLEKKELKFFVQLSPFTKPQDDLIRVSVIVPEKDRGFRFDLDPKPLEILDYTDFSEEVKTEEGFLKTTYLVTLSNQGNVRHQDQYKIASSFFKNIFVTTVPRAEKVQGNLVWDIDLKSNDSELIMYTFNFQPILIISIAILIILISYFVFRSPVVMRKTATVIATKEGGISELKIIIEIINRSKKQIKHVKIIDNVPRIAELAKEYDVGTVKPDKVVQHERKGTLVKWSLDEVDPGEERVISYKVKSKLSILGGVTLPSAAAKFDVGKRHRTANSNTPVIGFIG